MPERSPLAPSFFLLAHDSFTGKMLISEDLLCCGVVGAQLIDLLLDRRLEMRDGRVTPLETTPRADGDKVAAYMMEAIVAQPDTHIVRTWVDNLGLVPELVARGLVERGVLRREVTRRLLAKDALNYPAVDLLQASRPLNRVQHGLRQPRDLDLEHAVLAALIWAVGGERTMLDRDLDRGAASAVVDQILAGLAPGLAAVVDGVRAAAAAVSLRIRR